MAKLLIIIIASLLSACATTKNYCTEIRMQWGDVKYTECLMVQALVNSEPPIINVRIVN